MNYEIRAPEPFTAEVHEDLFADLARITKQKYRSDYDMHIDLSRTFKRLNDGHCVWINRCYVSDDYFFLSDSSDHLFRRIVRHTIRCQKP